VCVGSSPSRARGCLTASGDDAIWAYPRFFSGEYPSVPSGRSHLLCDGTSDLVRHHRRHDLALAWSEEDTDLRISKGVAQASSSYHRRHGGQSQFAASIDLAPKTTGSPPALCYARDHSPKRSTVATVRRLGSGMRSCASSPGLPGAGRHHAGACGWNACAPISPAGGSRRRGEPVETPRRAVDSATQKTRDGPFFRLYGHRLNRSDAHPKFRTACPAHAVPPNRKRIIR